MMKYKIKLTLAYPHIMKMEYSGSLSAVIEPIGALGYV